MTNLYNFTNEQIKQVNELLSNEYDSLWSSVIYRNSNKSTDIVKIATAQIGNIGVKSFRIAIDIKNMFNGVLMKVVILKTM